MKIHVDLMMSFRSLLQPNMVYIYVFIEDQGIVEFIRMLKKKYQYIYIYILYIYIKYTYNI